MKGYGLLQCYFPWTAQSISFQKKHGRRDSKMSNFMLIYQFIAKNIMNSDRNLKYKSH